ncbi:LOW QUALITY PROTEIN: coiled-coil domain-containing protein 151 [Alligator sinensis]|uniref:LOW QUALITY PROTEIN: coiled-coil domain-containing protein 151 n=1 Tax=Alligator sinensis TaxID=38654 RepID=A0A1U7S2Z4_ALLSI|nr:LOW QUALITY PROTEIN: coiled-coil domain-containing protein 151 [Alligator sinensis]
MPATLDPAGVKGSVPQQISELQSKIQLLEGDRKAFYESAQGTVQRNRETALCLRRDNKQLRKRLADVLVGDEKLIREVFQDRAADKAAMKNKTGDGAAELLQHRLAEQRNRLNLLRHQTGTRRQRLAQLQLQWDARVREEPHQPNPATVLRGLENRLEKAQLKVEEAARVGALYLQLKAHMQEQSRSRGPRLDALEAEVRHLRQQLCDLQGTRAEAQAARDAAREQLAVQEAEALRGRQNREQALAELRRQAEERRAQAERPERRVPRERGSVPGEDVAASGGAGATGPSPGTAQRLLGAQETFDKVKAATGVARAQDVLARFREQEATQRRLRQLGQAQAKELERRQVQAAELQAKRQALAYSGDAQHTGAQQLLRELQGQLREAEGRRDATRQRLEGATKVLLAAGAGLEHLASKVQHLPLESGHWAEPLPPPGSREHLPELLGRTAKRLQQLQEALEGHDQTALCQAVAHEEFQAQLEGCLPSANVRVALPSPRKPDAYYEEEASGEDEAEVLTRAALKRQAQQILDARGPRRPPGPRHKDPKA